MKSLRNFLIMLLVAASIAAAISTPVVLIAGAAVRNSADSFDNLPSTIQAAIPDQRSVILDASGGLIANIYLTNRQSVSPGAISTPMKQSIVAIEDSRFYQHNGADPKGLLRAAIHDLASSNSLQGASTIEMQYAKLARLDAASTTTAKEAAAAQNADRKLADIRYALVLDKKFSKDQILTMYLNLAYFGSNSYGVEAAAEYYFNTTAAKLTYVQAATIAGIVKNPSRYDPAVDAVHALQRRNIVLQRLLSLGQISLKQEALFEKSPLGLKITPLKTGCASSYAPFFCDWVRSTLQNNVALGATASERAARLQHGGLVIKTNLDPFMQKNAQSAVDSTISKANRVATAIVIIKPGTGQVQAMAVNRTYGANTKLNQTEINLATAPSFQGGSTFKPIVLATALEKGISPSLVLTAPVHYTSSILKNPFPGYYVNDADSEAGVMNLAEATWNSVNTYYVQLEEKVGVWSSADMARRLGVTSLPANGDGTNNTIRPDEGSFTLGTRPVDPLSMANVYATLANHGLRCDPLALSSVSGMGYSYIVKPSCVQVLSPVIADETTSILQGVITSGTGKSADINRPAAGKTGTTDNLGAAWFAGYTPNLAAAVWVGDPRGAKYTLTNVEGVSEVYGGTLPAIVWRKAMAGSLQKTPVVQFIPSNPLFQSYLQYMPLVVGLPFKNAVSILQVLKIKYTVSSALSSLPSQTITAQSISPGSLLPTLSNNGAPSVPVVVVLTVAK